MGHVDVTTRFTHYNSYKLEPGEELYGTPFDVEYYSAINSQAQVICKGSTAEGAMYMTWLAEDGSKLGREEFEFAVTGRWVRQTWMNEPPENAVRAMWSIKNTDDTEAWNVACAMTSAGEMAGAFDPSLAGHVSLLTASGLYTGTVTANQVVTGLLQATDGRAWFDLDKPEIVMQGESTVWKASPENPLRVENKDGELLGGLVNAGGQYLFVSRGLATSDSPDYFLKAGDIYRGEFLLGCGIRAYHKSNTEESLAEIALMSGPAIVLQLDDSMLYITEEPMPYNFYYTYTHPTTHDMLLFTGESDWGWEIGHYPYSGGGGALGVDATGPFYTQDGVQSYLHTQTKTGAQNFNNYLTQGTWFFNDAAHTNSPQGNSGGILRVTTDGNFVLQEYLTYNDAWQRRKVGTGAWNAWFSVK